MTDSSGARAGSATLASARARADNPSTPPKAPLPRAMAPWQPGLASQRQPQPSPDKLSHADPAFGGPRTQRALGVASREPSGCRYDHGFIGHDIDRQLRLSECGSMTESLGTQNYNLYFPPLSDCSPSEFEARVFSKPFSLLCSGDSTSLPGIRLSGFSY